jgi:aminomethyltransferase
VRAGAKLIPFAGWEMPVQYTGIMEEHQTVRSALGVFDISHMGEFFVRGPAACTWLNGLLTNDVRKLALGESQYTFLLNEEGGVIDDLIVYRLDTELFLLVVNSSKIAEDFTWMEAHLGPDVVLNDRSTEFAALAVQGPATMEWFSRFFGSDAVLPRRNGVSSLEVDGLGFFVARTGYTGEDGVELFFPAPDAVRVWERVLATGAPSGVKPCGLGARDTLRLEMCYPLNGSDLSPNRTPLEAGLDSFVQMGKGDFIGRAALERQINAGIQTRLTPFKMNERGAPPRAHYPIFGGSTQIGEITSGTLSPSLGIGIGMAYLPVEHAQPGEAIEVDVRGRRLPATVARKPLYRRAAGAA